MYNIFQLILSVDQAMNAEIDTYEMLIRNNNGEFPGINFLHSLTTQEGNDAWIKASRKSLKNALNEQQNRKIYINLRQLLVCNIPNFARLFVMTSASICACNPTKLRA